MEGPRRTRRDLGGSPLRGKHLPKGPRSFRTDSRDGEPALRTGGHNVGDAAEAIQEPLRARQREAWNGCDHRQARVGSRRSWIDAARSSPLGASCQYVEPERRICGVRRTDQANPKLGNREESPSHRGRPERPGIEVTALDKQIRRAPTAREANDLRPDTALHDRQVEVAYALALDDRGADVVVPDGQRPALGVQPKRKQRLQQQALRARSNR